MDGKVRAELSMDPRLIVMLARKQYSMDPLHLLVRELLQNSVDAVRERQRRELNLGRTLDSKILITLMYNSESEVTYISCEDNGIGMSAQEFHDNFLRLGKTSKLMDNMVGGFGIGAKTAVLSNETWSVRSNDIMCNQDILYRGDFIQQVEPRVGTLIEVTMKNVNWWTLKRVMESIYLSDVSVHVQVSYDGNVMLDDETAGMKYPRRSLDEAEGYAQFIGEPVDIPLYGIVQGTNIFRMHGLVQFVERYNASRTTNLWFDFDPKVSVDSPAYPFNMNREGLSEYGTAPQDIRNLIQTHNTDVLSSQKIATTEKVLEVIWINPGKFAQGKRESKFEKGRFKANAGDSDGLRFKFRNNADDAEDNSKSDMALLVRKYKYDPDEKNYHVNILLVWKEIVEFCTSDYFALGITQDPQVVASRCPYQGHIYYIINPDAITATTAKGKILQMWSSAVHECSHEAEEAHNERFTSVEGEIFSETAEAIAENMHRWTRGI